MFPRSLNDAATRLAHHVAGLVLALDTRARPPRGAHGVQAARLTIYSAQDAVTRTIRRAA